MTEKLHELDYTIRKHHPEVHATLRPGVHLRRLNACREWFGWRDGQINSTSKLLFGAYRFIPSREGRDTRPSLRNGSTFQLAVLAAVSPALLISSPLLLDLSGNGYYCNQITRKVFRWCEGEQNSYFPSFGAFIDFLNAWSSSPARNATDAVKLEDQLLSDATG